MIRGQLDGIGESVDEAIDELREVAHGLYPPVLTDQGVVAALKSHARPASWHLWRSEHDGIGRHPAELESAVYYCCLEAIQNATKHGGPDVADLGRAERGRGRAEIRGSRRRPWIRLRRHARAARGCRTCAIASARSMGAYRSSPRQVRAPSCRAPSLCATTRATGERASSACLTRAAPA